MGFLGAGEFIGFIALGLIEGVVNLIIFFAIFTPHPSLDVLGWMDFCSSVSATLVMVGMFWTNRSLRERYGFAARSLSEDASKCVGDKIERQGVDDASHEKGTKTKIIVEGLCAMLLDLSVQLGLSIGVYMAGARMGIGPMYQISALQAAFPQYGLQYIMGLTMMWKIRGSQFLAQKEYVRFSNFFKVLCAFATALAICAFASLLPFRIPLSFDLAANACEFASEPECLPVYTSVFGGGGAPGTTMQNSAFVAFLPVLVAVCFYRMFKSGLYVSN